MLSHEPQGLALGSHAQWLSQNGEPMCRASYTLSEWQVLGWEQLGGLEREDKP